MSATSKGQTRSEQGNASPDRLACTAQPWRQGEGLIVQGFYPGTIIILRNGTLITERGQRSNDGGRSWSKPSPFVADQGHHITPVGLVRLPSGEIGYYYQFAAASAYAFGNEESDICFRWSSDECETWSDEVKIVAGWGSFAMPGAMSVLSNGRLLLAAYSMFITNGELLGASWGTYKGHRIKIESEGHYGIQSASRVYLSDDSGRTWKHGDAWLMGLRSGHEKWTDAFVEPRGVQLRDGRVLVLGRTLVGRVSQCVSTDNGFRFGYAAPTALVSSFSPASIARLPGGDLLLVYNQVSREEIRRGFRRSRLSSAVSRDDGITWSSFRNIQALDCLADRCYIPPDPVLTPIAADDDVLTVPDDFAQWHYPNLSVVRNEVFLSYLTCHYELGQDKSGDEIVNENVGNETLILPANWFV